MLDSQSNVYTVGTTNDDVDGQIKPGTNTIHSIFLQKYNFAGDKQWTKIIGPAGTGRFATAYSMAIDTNDNLYIAGSLKREFLPTLLEQGIFNEANLLVKYDSDGNMLWTKILDAGLSSDVSRCGSIAVDPNNNLHVGCTYTTIGNQNAVNLYHLDATPAGSTTPPGNPRTTLINYGGSYTKVSTDAVTADANYTYVALKYQGSSLTSTTLAIFSNIDGSKVF